MKNIAKLDTDPLIKNSLNVPDHLHAAWKKNWRSSYEVENCFDHDDLEWLTDLMYKSHTKRRVKKNGTLHFWTDLEIIKKKFEHKWKKFIPDINLEYNCPWEGNFVITSTPYNLHIDTGRADWIHKKEIVPNKQIIIPLFVCHTNKDYKDESLPPAGVAIFKNRFIRYGTNFCKSDTTYETDVFESVYDYNKLTCYDVEGNIVKINWNKKFDPELREKFFKHYNKNWLDGFELEKIYNYCRGNIIVFDRCQAHSGINFPEYKVTMKAMLAIMTTRKL